MNYRRVNTRCKADFCSCKVGISPLPGGQLRQPLAKSQREPLQTKGSHKFRGF